MERAWNSEDPINIGSYFFKLLCSPVHKQFTLHLTGFLEITHVRMNRSNSLLAVAGLLKLFVVFWLLARLEGTFLHLPPVQAQPPLQKELEKVPAGSGPCAHSHAPGLC